MKYGKTHWKTCKKRNVHLRTWIMGRELKNVENETHTLYVLEYGEEQWKTWKGRNSHGRNWNKATNSEKPEKREINTLGPVLWQENEKPGKWDTNTVGPWIWREKWPTIKMRKPPGSTWNMARNILKSAKWGTHNWNVEYG